MPNPNKEHYEPKRWRPVLPTLFILSILLFGVGGVWGFNQVMTGLNNTGVNVYASGTITSAENTYHNEHGSYTKNPHLPNHPLDPSANISVKILSTCSTGWVAQVKGNISHSITYVSSTGDQKSDLSALTLPSCISLNAVGSQAQSPNVTIDTVQVSRMSQTQAAKDPNVSTWVWAAEGARVIWGGKAQCEPGQKPSYEVSVTEAPSPYYTQDADEGGTRTYDTTASNLYVDGIQNGITYNIGVKGSCDGTFETANAKSTTFTQSLPAPHMRVTKSSNGNSYYVLVGSSSSDHVRYDIQYRHSYAGGWSTWVQGYSYGAVNPGNYYSNYGDEFRARAYVGNHNPVSDWGTSSTLNYAYSSYSYGY